MAANSSYLYEQLAGFITGLVDSGTLPPGARVPSLRHISRQRRVSLSAALQAYRLLEDRGILEARPQSGYYVAHGAGLTLGRPSLSRPPAKATSVAISGVVMKLLEYAADPRFVPLGCAIPSSILIVVDLPAPLRPRKP